MNTEIECGMLQHQMSLPPLRVEGSPIQTSDFSNGTNQNSGQYGFNDFTFAASNSNHYNNTVGDHVIHLGNYDEPLIMSNNYMNQVFYKTKFLKIVFFHVIYISALHKLFCMKT